MDAESQKTFNEHFDHCTVYTKECTCVYKYCKKVVTVVDAVWKDVDRPMVGGWSHHNFATVMRMATAIYAGVVFDKVAKRIDVNGKSYISAWCNIYWKQANADLKKLGF